MFFEEMKRTAISCWTVAILVTLPVSAIAGPCDAYFTFDGTLADASGNGYDGVMFGKDGVPASPNFVEGKQGQSLQLDGKGAMRALLDLHYDACPKVTVSAWIKVLRSAPDDSLHVLSTGGGSGPGLNISGTFLNLKGTGNGIGQPKAVRKGSWIFVAGVYDYTAGEYTLHWGGRSATQKLSEHRYEPQNAVWVGTVHDDWGVFARGIAIDDLRITGRAFNSEQVAGLRMRSSQAIDVATVQDEIFVQDAVFVPAGTQLPGDQYEPTQLPGDQYEPTQLPGDQYEPTQIPGQLPGIVDRSGDAAARPLDVVDIPKPDVGDRPDVSETVNIIDDNGDTAARTEDVID